MDVSFKLGDTFKAVEYKGVEGVYTSEGFLKVVILEETATDIFPAHLIRSVIVVREEG